MIQDTIIAALSAELAQGNGQPLYRRLVSAIERLVADGHLKRGMLLPSERDLVAKLGVSRVTVRKALDVLIGEGIIGDRGAGRK